MYSPFNKPVVQLVAKDLVVLKNLPEGWFIEYKRVMIDQKKIAKSVAAFANTDGGWLFFGVEELDEASESNKFTGIPKAKIHINKQQIVQSVSHYINPVPSFNIQVCDGPCTEIDLPGDSSIIAVQVPYSRRTPHIHLNGKIYTRTSDHSEPVPQTNRFQLDLLWQRGEEVRENVRQWVANDPEFTANEKGIPYFRLLLMVDPWMPIPETWVKADRTKVKEILRGSSADPVSVNFDTVHTYQEGYLCRQFIWGQPVHYGLTFQVFSNLSCELNVPLGLLKPEYFKDARCLVEEDGYAHKEQYYYILEEQKHESSRIVDLNFVWSCTVAVVDKYLKLLKLAQVSPTFRFKTKLLNVSRVVPFIDSKVVIDYCEKHKLPMIMERDLKFPSGSGINSFFQMETAGRKQMAAVQGSKLFIQFLRSLGIEVTDRYEDLLPDLNKILQRATDERILRRFLREEDEDEDNDWSPPRF